MTKPFSFQLEGVRKIKKFKGRALLADEMGLGKTFQALYYLKKHPKKRPVLIISPASIKYVWEEEAKLHFNLNSTVLCGTKPPRKKPLTKNSIYIINYKILHHWKKYIKKYIKPKMIIYDEAHYIKNANTLRSQTVKSICNKKKYILPITGTPLLSRPIELFPTLNILWPDHFSELITFATEYSYPRLIHGKMQFHGARNTKKLYRKLCKLGMIRRLKKDVMEDLPPKRKQIVPIKLNRFQEYLDAENDFLKWLEKTNPSKLRKAKKAEVLVRIGYLRRLIAELKFEGVIDWIDNFLAESDGKLVLYGIHKKFLRPLYKHYKNIAVIIDGDTPQKDRKKIKQAFQTNKKIRLFIGSIKAAGTGITLTASSNLAFIELDFVPGEMNQVEDRVHRISQNKSVIIYYLVALDTYEIEVAKKLQQKQRDINKILQGDSGNSSDMDIYKMILRIIKKTK